MLWHTLILMICRIEGLHVYRPLIINLINFYVNFEVRKNMLYLKQFSFNREWKGIT